MRYGDPTYDKTVKISVNPQDRVDKVVKIVGEYGTADMTVRVTLYDGYDWEVRIAREGESYDLAVRVENLRDLQSVAPEVLPPEYRRPFS